MQPLYVPAPKKIRLIKKKCILIYQFHCEILILNESITFKDLLIHTSNLWELNEDDISFSSLEKKSYSSVFKSKHEYYNCTLTEFMGKNKVLGNLIIYVNKSNEKMEDYLINCNEITPTKVL